MVFTTVAFWICSFLYVYFLKIQLFQVGAVNLVPVMISLRRDLSDAPFPIKGQVNYLLHRQSISWEDTSFNVRTLDKQIDDQLYFLMICCVNLWWLIFAISCVRVFPRKPKTKWRRLDNMLTYRVFTLGFWGCWHKDIIYIRDTTIF
jgi:hypothetical protein